MERVCAECGRRVEGGEMRCPDDGSPTIVVGPRDDLVGRTVDGRFVVRDLVGSGGMGAVYRAHQLSMDRDVALKVLRRDLAGDEQAVRRFFREARAASRLKNPHTITVFDFGQMEDGQLYLAMELLSGRSLSAMLSDEDRPMEVGRAARIVTQVLDALVEAHSVGVLHRDLKPDNVFVLEGAGSDEFVKVLDFGIAKIQAGSGATSLTGTGMAFGTPTYMSPEQAEARELDARSDLYSVGVMLFEMLAGKPPFEAATPLALILRKVQERPPTVFHVNPDVRIPAAMDDLLAGLLAPAADGRPASAADAKRLLSAALVGPATSQVGAVEVRGGVTTRVPVTDPRSTPDRALDVEGGPVPTLPMAAIEVPRRRFSWPLVAVGGALVVAAGTAAWLLASSGPTAPPDAPSPAAPRPVISQPAVPQPAVATPETSPLDAAVAEQDVRDAAPATEPVARHAPAPRHAPEPKPEPKREPQGPVDHGGKSWLEKLK